MVTLLLVGMLALAFNIQPVKAEGTIYIKADGSIEPPTAPISTVGNVAYTLTGDITSDADGIVVERENIVIDGDGYMLQGTGAGHGIKLDGSNITVKNIKIRAFHSGISILGYSNNSIVGNNVTECQFGVWFGGLVARNTLNNIVGNSMKNNDYAISVNGFSNYIAGNDIKNSVHGILIDGSSNDIVGNSIATNEWYGIKLEDSYNNTILGNIIGSSFRGVVLYSSSNNSFHHNNFGGISQTFESTNLWDDGYPSGGNYWSDYEGRYPDAEEMDDSAIWDTPYVIDENNQDNYPLMNPWVAPPPSYTLTIHSSPSVVTFTADTVSHTTPWSVTYNEGASVSLVMPEAYDGYVWSHWLEDGDTNRIKTVIMDTNITLTAVFTPAVDTTPPTISILSPENKTYLVNDVSLTFTVSESTSWIAYSLDGQDNAIITGNTTFSELSDGPHSIVVYAKDTAGNTGISEMIYFTIETSRSEPFPLWIVAAIVIIAVAGVGPLVYFTRVKKTTRKPNNKNSAIRVHTS